MTEIDYIKQLAYYGLNNIAELNTFDPADIFKSRINVLRERFNTAVDLSEVLSLCDELRKLHTNFFAFHQRWKSFKS